jgi:hypothetical protein
MSYKAIKQAEKTFRIAIYGRAAQFDMATVHRAESLLLQARAFLFSDPIKSKSLAENAEQIALEAIAKTQTEKTRLKGVLSTDVASLIQEYSHDKIALGAIKMKISIPTYLIISQRIGIAGVCVKQAEEGLKKEQFSAFPELYARTRQRLLDVAHVLTPVLEQLNYSGHIEIPLPKQKVA